MSRTLIVTRHAGAVEMLRELGVEGEVVETLTPETVAALTPADRVYGPLPVRLIAALTARGVPYYAIDMGLDAAQRGRELGPAEMRASGATAQRYAVYPIPALPETLGLDPPAPPRQGRFGGFFSEASPRLKATSVALVAAAAFNIATVIVGSVWDGIKALIANPAAIAAAAGRALKGEIDGWSLLRSAAEAGAALTGLALAIVVARKLAGRVLHTTFRSLRVEPRRVLIQGLSPLRDVGAAEPFRQVDLRYSGLSQDGLGAAKAALQERLAATPADPVLRAALEEIGRIPARVAWQQNLRAILSHAPGLKRIYIIPTQESDGGGGEAQARAFCDLLREILRRSGFGQVTVELAPSGSINYEDHDQALAAITGAMRAARAARGQGLRDEHIAIDCTAGTKVFSIAAAVATINSRALLTYVNNKGETLAYDGRMSIAEAKAEA